MLPTLKRRIAPGLFVVADVAGVALAGSSAAVVVFLGKFMLAIVLGAISLGFFLRLVGRRRTQAAAPPAIPVRSRVVSMVLAAVEVALLVEATNFPVRFDQPGFEPWHWVLVLVAFVTAYSLNLRLVRSVIGRRHVTTQR